MANRNQLTLGSQGSDVVELQKLLNQNGFTLDTDGIFGSQTQDAVRQYQEKMGLDVDGIVGNNTWGSLGNQGANATEAPSAGGFQTKPFEYKPYQESDAVKQAQALLQQQMAGKPGQYASPWQGQLNEIMDKILNREKFSYDMNADALYQQYKDQYIQQGQMAMMDTMGQAAAMTGGYGNSYGQSVGQQAYQGYLQQLNDKVPELYQLALSKYQMEGDALMDQYGILGAKEEQEYGRYRDQVSDWEREQQRLQAQYQDERNFDYGKYSDDRNFGYGQYVDDRNFGYGQYIDDRNYQYQVGRDQVSDKQWQAEFDEALRQFNFANGLGEFAPAAAGGGSGSGGKNWLNADGSVNLNMISQSSDWWKQYAAENGLDPKTGKKLGGGNQDTGGLNRSQYASWGMGEWEAYFASIRQTEGKAAAEEELKKFTSQGIIPQVYVSMASNGARGGGGGH